MDVWINPKRRMSMGMGCLYRGGKVEDAVTKRRMRSIKRSCKAVKGSRKWAECMCCWRGVVMQ